MSARLTREFRKAEHEARQLEKNSSLAENLQTTRGSKIFELTVSWMADSRTFRILGLIVATHDSLLQSIYSDSRQILGATSLI
jgi:hypothetical protein